MNRLFWEYKAKDYPGPFDKDILDEAVNIFKFIKKCGVDFENKKVIDVGCGSGVYSFIFSKYAGEVLAVDFSKKMLEVLEKERKSKKVGNIKTLNVDFKKLDLRRYRKKFDIAFVSMSPAVRSINDIKRFISLSNKWCIFIGWVWRKNNLIDGVYRKFNVRKFLPQGYYNTIKFLKGNNIDYRVKYLNVSWQEVLSWQKAVREIEERLKLVGVEPNRLKINSYIRGKYKNGKIISKTKARKAVIVWRVQNEK